jgi:hypothetical protein
MWVHYYYLLALFEIFIYSFLTFLNGKGGSETSSVVSGNISSLEGKLGTVGDTVLECLFMKIPKIRVKNSTRVARIINLI